MGVFLAFQYPVAIPGVSFANFLRAAISNVRGYKDRARADTDFKVNLKNEVNIETLLRELSEFRAEFRERTAVGEATTAARADRSRPP